MGRCVHTCNGNEPCELDCLAGFKARQMECPCEVSIFKSVYQYDSNYMSHLLLVIDYTLFLSKNVLVVVPVRIINV